jgi:hypothetical protein
MFAKTIIDSDKFLDMPLSTQALYFHLSMRADDEGFISNPKKIMRMIGSDEDSMKLLIAKQFIIPFESGIVVIKHWKIHNYIQSDRFKETICTEERKQLGYAENREYVKLDTECIHDVSSLETQYSIGKNSIDKISIDKDSIDSGKPQKHKHGEFKHVLLTDDEYSKLCKDYGQDIADKYIQKVDEYCEMKGKSYKNYNLAIRNTFMSRDNVKPLHRTEADLYKGLTKDSEGFYVDKDGNRYV